jgi:acyl-CoA reductase-like NAD-dependent aldehyde dehydrogenase
VASAEQADEAVARAAAAQPGWGAAAPGDRARLLRDFAAAVDEHAEELAGLEIANSGHPVARSRILVQRSVFDPFMELLEPAVTGIVVGDPARADTVMGPLISAAKNVFIATED